MSTDCTKDTDYWLVQNYPKWFKKTLNKTTPPEGRVADSYNIAATLGIRASQDKI